MDVSNDSLESFWDHLLSRQAVLIRAAFATISQQEQDAVIAHLERMAGEAGWHPEQRKSAQVALQTLLPGQPLEENRDP